VSRRRGRWPAPALREHAVARARSSELAGEGGNAPRRAAGWVRRDIDCTAGWSNVDRSWRWHRRSLVIRRSTDETPWPAASHPLERTGGSTRVVSQLSREDGNAPRSDGGWVRRDIDCTAGWSNVDRSWRWHCRSLAIRRSTDERRAQTRVASKRVRGLQELRTGQRTRVDVRNGGNEAIGEDRLRSASEIPREEH